MLGYWFDFGMFFAAYKLVFANHIVRLYSTLHGGLMTCFQENYPILESNSMRASYNWESTVFISSMLRYVSVPISTG